MAILVKSASFKLILVANRNKASILQKDIIKVLVYGPHYYN